MAKHLMPRSGMSRGLWVDEIARAVPAGAWVAESTRAWA
jgi:hypothetical protein